MKDLYIIGAGGFGREVAWLVRRINEQSPTWNLVGFIDDDVRKHGTLEDGYPVVGGTELLGSEQEDTYVVCAVGSAQIRKSIVDKLKVYSKIKYATLIDPSVIISDRVKIGEGSIMCAGTIVTVDVVLGKHVIINLDCTVGHDAVIGNFVTMYPSVNVSGMVRVGECVELGTGMQVIQGKKIVEKAIIGAGGVVVKDILDEGTYVGVPVVKVKDIER